jgi:uncharacterized membrane protein (UPF0127 family)
MMKTALLVASLALSMSSKPQTAAKQTQLTTPGGTLLVDVVDTPESREIGLMHRKKLPAKYGMLFVFPFPTRMQFWMKNTLIPLDILFIGSDKKVTAVHENVKASTYKTLEADVARAAGYGLYVLELPAGGAKRWKLEKGSQLSFDAVIPEK